MKKRTVIYCLVMMVCVLLGYFIDKDLDNLEFASGVHFMYGVTSENGVINIPPTAWLSTNEMRTSLRSVLLSKYLLSDNNNIDITVFKGMENKSGSIKTCDMKRFHLDSYDYSNINKIFKNINEWKFFNCP
ncbi:hypothetical protein DP806_16345 [Salmonella enterica subsp. enterica serovar Saintpaul]|nr:hypothetical protein [Salmonella enterica subsp. enterica serovar Saintpaul]